MTAATITPGSKVKVEYTAKYRHAGMDSGRHIMEDPITGAEVYAPKDAKVTVLEHAEPEPPVGTVMKVNGYNLAVARRYDGWFGTGSLTRQTWKSLREMYGTNLVPVVQDPTPKAYDIEKYPLRVPVRGDGFDTKVIFGYQGGSITALELGSVFTGKIDPWVARDLAFAILKATGGM